MKYLLIALIALFGFSGTAFAVSLDSPNPELITQVWGLRGIDTPKMTAGSATLDQGGFLYDCPVWMKWGCYDITGTAYYEDQLLKTARQMIANGQNFPQFSYWLAKVR